MSTNYTPNPLAVCESPTPCPDPCATQAYILHRQTQPIPCDPINSPSMLEDLLVYWKMEEDNITRQDSHTGNHDLSVTGTVPSYVGKILNAATFDGASGKRLESNESVFGLTGAYTMALWVQFSDVSAGDADTQFIIGKYHYVSLNGYKLILEGGLLKLRHANDGSGSGTTNQVVSSAVITSGVWYFIVCGSTGSTQFIQVNNGTRESVPGLTPAVSSINFRISEDFAEGPFFGLIDEVGVWLNRALSVAEASYLYNGGAGRTYPFT